MYIPVPSKEIKALVKRADDGEVEELWFSKLEGEEAEADFFLAVAKELEHSGRKELAAVLLAILFEHFDAKNNFQDALRAQSMIALMEPENLKVRKVLADYFLKAFNDYSSIGELVAACRIEKGDNLKEAIEDFEKWLPFSVDRIVYHPKGGAGIVKEIKFARGEIKIQFRGRELQSFPIMGAVKTMKTIQTGHFLEDCFKNPEMCKKMCEENPEQAMRRFFSGFDEPLSSSEIKECFALIIPEGSWNSFWGNVKKLPQLHLQDASGKYYWQEISLTTDDLLGKYCALQGEDRLQFIRKIFSVEPQKALQIVEQEHMVYAQSGLIKEKEIPFYFSFYVLVEELFPFKVRELKESPESLLLKFGLSGLLLNLENYHHRRKILNTFRAKNPDTWKEVWRNTIFSEVSTGNITFIFNELFGDAGEESIKNIVTEIISRRQEAPYAFSWLLEQKDILARIDSDTVSDMVKAAVLAIADSRFEAVRSKMRGFFNPGGLFVVLMKKTAKPVLKLLLDKVEAGLLPKDQSRAALRKEIFTAFPEIDPFKKARVREMILCSEKGRNKKIIELKNLAETEIPQNSKAIEKARELGDLRENAEYKAAKERQQFLVAKIELLKEELSNCKVLKPEDVKPDKIKFGTVVTLGGDQDSNDIVITIMGPWETDPENHVYSYQAPAVNRLLGKEKGDVVEFLDMEMTVREITVYGLNV